MSGKDSVVTFSGNRTPPDVSWRNKDILRGLSWTTVPRGDVAAFLENAGNTCVPGLRLPGLRFPEGEETPGFFCLSNMSRAAAMFTGHWTREFWWKQGLVPVFFEMEFSVRVSPYTPAEKTDWMAVEYFQMYKFSRKHSDALWNTVRLWLMARGDSGPANARNLLRHMTLEDAMDHETPEVLSLLWKVFPDLRAVSWALPGENASGAQMCGLLLRDVSMLHGQVFAMMPKVGEISADWKLCAGRPSSDWPGT